MTPLASAPPAAAAYASPQAASPSCGSHSADADSCVINFGPAASSPALHPYPPADMPTETDVVDVSPTSVSLQQAASEMQKMDEKILKEMEEKLTATCVGGK